VFRKTKKVRSGVSLIEAMSAILVLSIAVIGASSYRYYNALDVRKADAHITAARIGYLLCESWRGLQGADTYDPIAHLGSDLAITASKNPDAPEGFTLLGTYKVLLNDVHYDIVLSWQDGGSGLRALNIVLFWTLRGQVQDKEQVQDNIDDVTESFKLTAYVLN